MTDELYFPHTAQNLPSTTKTRRFPRHPALPGRDLIKRATTYSLLINRQTARLLDACKPKKNAAACRDFTVDVRLVLLLAVCAAVDRRRLGTEAAVEGLLGAAGGRLVVVRGAIWRAVGVVGVAVLLHPAAGSRRRHRLLEETCRLGGRAIGGGGGD